jgi:regulatory protein YycI of two-component signal transduction system YycFG
MDFYAYFGHRLMDVIDGNIKEGENSDFWKIAKECKRLDYTTTAVMVMIGRALSILVDHRKEVRAVAQTLMDKWELKGDEITEVIEKIAA